MDTFAGKQLRLICQKCFCPLPQQGSTLKQKKFASRRDQRLKALVCRKECRKSQKLFSLDKMMENLPVVHISLKRSLKQYRNTCTSNRKLPPLKVYGQGNNLSFCQPHEKSSERKKNWHTLSIFFIFDCHVQCNLNLSLNRKPEIMLAHHIKTLHT